MKFVMTYNSILSRAQISKWKPDLVHETYYSKKSLAPKCCPTVITVYDMIHEIFKANFPSGDETSQLKKNSIKRSDHVICISHNTKQDLIQLFDVPEKKISVVHLGFDRFIQGMNQSKIDCDKFRPFLLYVGARSGYKNFNAFIRAVSTSKRMMSELNIVCFGGHQFSNMEKSLFKTLGFRENQVIPVTGDDSLLGFFYRAALAFVYPSLYEGFGIPPLEAMANYCPVICSNVSSIPEVVGDAGKYFNPSDIDEMREAIENVIYSDSQIKTLKKLGEKRLLNFSWKKCADETLAIYKTLGSRFSDV